MQCPCDLRNYILYYFFQHSCRQLLYSSARWKCALPINLKTTVLNIKPEQVNVQLFSLGTNDDVKGKIK